MGKRFDKGLAELAAYGRFGLQDAQRLVMGEWHGSTPASPGMAGTITPAEADRQLNQDGVGGEPGVQAPSYLDEKVQQPVAPEPEVEMEME